MGTLQVASGFSNRSAERQEHEQSVAMQTAQSFAIKVAYLEEVLREHPNFSEGQPLELAVRLSDGQDWVLAIRKEQSEDLFAHPRVQDTIVEIQHEDGRVHRSFRFDEEVLLRRIAGIDDGLGGVTVTKGNGYTLPDYEAIPLVSKMSENVAQIAADVERANAALVTHEQEVLA